jgi:hypothetical protein
MFSPLPRPAAVNAGCRVCYDEELQFLWRQDVHLPKETVRVLNHFISL